MSAKGVSPPTAAEAVTKAKQQPSLSAVPILDTAAANGFSNARPAALLGLLAVQFGALVQDPVTTLTTSLAAVATIQIAYAVVCLPVAGSTPAKQSKKARPGDKKKAEAAVAPNAISTAILSLLLTSIVVPAVHLLFVLFGAPFLDHVKHTLLCSAHFALLGIFPILYTRGMDSEALIAVAGAAAPLDETFGGLVGAVLGAWLGAVPIPLDWDREWQKWPVTIVVGMYLGHCVGSRVVGAIFYGKRLASVKEADDDL